MSTILPISIKRTTTSNQRTQDRSWYMALEIQFWLELWTDTKMWRG